MEEKRFVYLCPTLLSLMNSIVTQLTVNKDYPADIVFEDTSDFSEISQRLMRHGVFKKCYFFEAKEAKEKYHAATKEERCVYNRKPSALFTFPNFEDKYTDFCTHIDSYASKFLYYGMLQMGMSPKIHFVSEGTATYSLNFSNTKKDKIDHAFYKDKAFLKNVQNIYVYKPDLYTGGADFVNLVELPNYGTLGEDVYAIISDVFGTAEPIEEKLIFFEGAFWGDGMLVDEMELFLDIANHIGKDNIIVKRHPRNTVDRFTPLGFKVMPNQTIPWEVMIKDIDLSNKVLVSVASFTCFSAMEMYGRISRSLLLKNIMRGRVYFLEDPGYKQFFRTTEKLFNAEEIVSWSPKSIKEMHIALDAIGEKIGGWNK